MAKNEIDLIDSMILHSRQRFGQEMKVYKQVGKKIEQKIIAYEKVPELEKLLGTWKYVLGAKTV